MKVQIFYFRTMGSAFENVAEVFFLSNFLIVIVKFKVNSYIVKKTEIVFIGLALTDWLGVFLLNNLFDDEYCVCVCV